MVEDEVVGISRSTLFGFLMMTEILKVRRLDSGAQSTHTYAQKHDSLTHQEAEIVTSELVQLFIMAWPHQPAAKHTHTQASVTHLHTASLGGRYQTLETLRLTFILMRPDFSSFSLSIRIVSIRVLHCNSF